MKAIQASRTGIIMLSVIAISISCFTLLKIRRADRPLSAIQPTTVAQPPVMESISLLDEEGNRWDCMIHPDTSVGQFGISYEARCGNRCMLIDGFKPRAPNQFLSIACSRSGFTPSGLCFIKAWIKSPILTQRVAICTDPDWTDQTLYLGELREGDQPVDEGNDWREIIHKCKADPRGVVHARIIVEGLGLAWIDNVRIEDGK